MAQSTTLSTVMSRDVSFDNLERLNADMRDHMVDFEDEFADGKPVVGFADGKLLFRGYEDDRPMAVCEVWSTWSLKTSRIVAKHMVAGRIVLKLDHEYGDQEYHVLTPGKAETADIASLLGG